MPHCKMWLINTSTFQLHEFTGITPPYATFSYDMEENKATFEDLLQIPRYICRDGIKTIEKACSQVRTTGSAWLWNHAACVEKRSSAAQSEAINALARIYRGCEQSIIYLDDFDLEPSAERTIRERLAGCRWINNIWSIPQIIFARQAHFFSSDWTRIGTKTSLLADLSFTMGIDRPALEDSDCLEDYSIARRMCWASRATALYIEDNAYALLGLFDVNMSIIYGEGRKAFQRLQELIMRDTDDFSLLAWDPLGSQEFYGIFAPSPSCFDRFRTGVTSPLRLTGEARIHCSGITIEASFWKTDTDLFLPLKSQEGPICFIPLVQWDNSFVRRAVPVKWEMPGPKSVETLKICIKRDLSAHVSRKISCIQRIVREGSFDSFESLDHGSTTRGSEDSATHNSSIYGIRSMASYIDGFCATPRCAPNLSLNEVTLHEGFIARPNYDRYAVESALGALDIKSSASWVHDGISEIDYSTEGHPVNDTEETENWSPQVEVSSSEMGYGSEAHAPINGSQAVEAQQLDVDQITQELAPIAAGHFLRGRPRQSKKRSFSPSQQENRKRPKLAQSLDRVELDGTSDTDVMEGLPVAPERFLACPFYIRNNKYTDCVTGHQLRSIEDVTEHVTLEHRRPMFCPICKQEFPSGHARDSHIRLRTCKQNDSSIPEGITDAQEEQIDMESESSLAEDLQWFHIWDIIFPCIKRPSSVFYAGEREVRVCAFKEFWARTGEQIIESFLEKRHCQSHRVKNEERTLRAIYGGVEGIVVDRLFRDFDNIKAEE